VPIAIVTGGAGFIGSHAVEKLIEKDYVVRVIDNLVGGRIENIKQFINSGKCEFFQIDIRELATDSKIFKDVDFILHFAGIGDIVPSIQKPAEYMAVNVQGTVRVLEAARANKVKRFVYAASSSCYGATPNVPTDENAEIKNEYPYALSKYLGEVSAFHWAKVYGIKVNSIRIFNAYGTRSKTTGAYGAVFGVFLKQKLAGKPLTIVGDGEQSRDFVYASDVAEAFILAGETSLQNQIWNLGSNNPISVNTLANLIGGEKVFLPKRPGEPDITWANNKKIVSELGWSPKVSFEAGVSKILANIEYWKNAPLWDKNSIEKATEDWFKFMGQQK
jgi:UDP-glucose 4-epimerase